MLPLYIPKEARYLNTPSNAPTSEKLTAYTNQLVSQEQKYATIKTIPYTFFRVLAPLVRTHIPFIPLMENA